ncbi:hypothetical protein [Lysobacter enzymogenes]|uniref:hypothetical protein n=1 Tax=Lysobacter enzymogenes TaxID=69 RepID=UPI001A9797C9|nr:hypothetical protein [Lysobacter enzymogenes]QQP96258.1 hypothetical protein JHW38_24150 [Lysobacter enzymogenes]
MSAYEPPYSHVGEASAPTLESPDEEVGPLSQFRHGAQDRRLLELARLDAGLAANADFDDKPWGLLYRALVDSIGLSPDDFQLTYPSAPWDWPCPQQGFVHAAQYDFCATAPQWSAIGAYVSSGDTVHQAYQQFLNTALAQTDYRSLRQHLNDADDALTTATNQYTLATTSAASAYAAQVEDNQPSFTQWLGGARGHSHQARIVAAQSAMNRAQAHYAALVAQCQSPELGQAQRRCGDERFHVRFSDLNLIRMPKVPDWRLAQSSDEWVAQVEAGRGPAGVTLGFSNREAPYDFAHTWAGRRGRIRQLFWQARINGRWERIDEFEFDNKLELSLDFQAVDTIAIRPGEWFDGEFARSMIDGPFMPGYSAFGGDTVETRGQPVFGERGFFGLVKSGLCVGYRPSFAIRTSTSTFRRFVDPFKAATALRIGPFVFEAEGGSAAAGWHADAASQTFTGASTSRSPLILGATVAELPNAGG